VTQTLASLKTEWTAAWPAAVDVWSRYTQLRDPVYFESDTEAKAFDMAGQIAAIRLLDHGIMVNLKTIRDKDLGQFAVPILAHEIGHHLFVPGNLTDNARMLGAIRRVLGQVSADVPHFVANLYGDLQINDRLQRRHNIDIAGVYAAINAEKINKPSVVWQIYTRIYEHLWSLKPGSLCPMTELPFEMEADAFLCSRLIRFFAGNWLQGVRRFTLVMRPYILEDEKERRAQNFVLAGLSDTKGAGKSLGGDMEAIPDGLTYVDEAELGDTDEFDAAFDSEFMDGNGADNKKDGKGAKEPRNTAPSEQSKVKLGQSRPPFEYGEILKALGLNLSKHEITTRYYRERAKPYLIPFPTRKSPQAREPLAEGYEQWDAGDAIENLDVFRTLLNSPIVIPGVTTEQRVYAEVPGSDPAQTPLDLDIYVDCSGSMPDPSRDMSCLALAGAILALSAFRSGAKVQATLWSGPRQFETSNGFLRDEKKIMGIICGYISGSTAFPLHVLRDTYKKRKPTDAPVHIVVISDSGVDTMFNKDEEGTPGLKLMDQALKAARGGASLALNLPANWAWSPAKEFEKHGYKVYKCSTMEQLVDFAREFVRANYGK